MPMDFNFDIKFHFIRQNFYKFSNKVWFKGKRLLTCSFDHTLSIWLVGKGKRECALIGHSAEISAGKFNFDGSLVVSGEFKIKSFIFGGSIWVAHYSVFLNCCSNLAIQQLCHFTWVRFWPSFWTPNHNQRNMTKILEKWIKWE